MTQKEKIKRAFELLRTIPVKDIHVDTMHEVRVLLAELHNSIVEEETESD